MTNISVVMPVYNASKYLKHSIESILNQTFKRFEFIIINDASTDNSLDIIRDYQERNPKINIINNETNIGLTESLNKGLKIAIGKYIARQDADDVSLKDRFKIQHEYLERNPGVFLVGGGVVRITESGETITVFKPITNEAKLKRKMEKSNTVWHSSMMFRNEGDKFYRNKFTYAQDYDFSLSLLSEKNRIINLPNVLVKCRIAFDSASYSKRAKQELFAKAAREFYFQRLKDGKDKYDEFNPEWILNVDVNNINDCDILGSEIEAAFRRDSFRDARNLYGRYLKNRKMPDKYFIYYLGTFFPKSFINFLRRVVWRFNLPIRLGGK